MHQRAAAREEYQKQINLIVEYINKHLDENIELNAVAQFSNFQPFHYHRITRAFLGKPIGAYYYPAG